MGDIQDSKLECRALKDGTMSVISTVRTTDGDVTSTITDGTPYNFLGVSIVALHGYSEITAIPVDSNNLGKDSLAGASAKIGKKDLLKCLGAPSV